MKILQNIIIDILIVAKLVIFSCMKALVHYVDLVHFVHFL
jgi:hypothetical protein